MKNQGSYGSFIPNNNETDIISIRGPMNTIGNENIIVSCDAIRIIFVYPATSEDDERIRNEVRAILLAALLEQMSS